MSIADALILGVLQGVTEFVPVSSSGHLILARDILDISIAGGLAFDAVLQLATAVAIIVYFRKDLYGVFCRCIGRGDSDNESDTLLWALVLGTIPAVVVGLLLEEYMETVFRNPMIVIGTLLAGAILMAGAEWLGRRDSELTASTGWWVGLFQVFALIPGFSRSGATIAGGMFTGLTREAATRFSFLLGAPILFGSGAKKFMDILVGSTLIEINAALIVGSVTSFFVGLGVIHYLLKYLTSHTLYVFVGYRVVIAVTALVFLL